MNEQRLLRGIESQICAKGCSSATGWLIGHFCGAQCLSLGARQRRGETGRGWWTEGWRKRQEEWKRKSNISYSVRLKTSGSLVGWMYLSVFSNVFECSILYLLWSTIMIYREVDIRARRVRVNSIGCFLWPSYVLSNRRPCLWALFYRSTHQIRVI